MTKPTGNHVDSLASRGNSKKAKEMQVGNEPLSRQTGRSEANLASPFLPLAKDFDAYPGISGPPYPSTINIPAATSSSHGNQRTTLSNTSTMKYRPWPASNHQAQPGYTAHYHHYHDSLPLDQTHLNTIATTMAPLQKWASNTPITEEPYHAIDSVSESFSNHQAARPLRSMPRDNSSGSGDSMAGGMRGSSAGSMKSTTAGKGSSGGRRRRG